MANPDFGDLLPGRRGRTYDIVRFGGKTYVLYTLKLPNGKKTGGLWRVKDEDLKNKTHGFGEGAGRTMSRAEYKRYWWFGTSSEIKRSIGGDKHPFKKKMLELRRRYRGASWLGDREVMSLYLEGMLEGSIGTPAFNDMLKKTKWFDERDRYERAWELDNTSKERANLLKTRRTGLRDALAELYGPNVDWREHVGGAELNTWAKRIESGKFGAPDKGLQEFLHRYRRRAEKVQGTAAWAQHQQEIEAINAQANKPEEIFGQIKKQASEWLGYHAVPADDLLRRKAEKLASGIDSQEDFDEWLRGRKQSLYKWLDPDETWMDRAGIYKGVAEDIYGTPIDWQDSLLRDLTARDEKGAAIGGGIEAMNLWDFERKARMDPRYRKTRNGLESGSAIADAISSFFTGRVA